MHGFTPLSWLDSVPRSKLLVVDALFSSRKRTVTAVLQVLGLVDDPKFGTFHRLLNRALVESPGQAATAHRLFAPSGPLVLGLDDTIEKRIRAKISAKGIYRDLVRSSGRHFVKASGCCLALLV